MRLNQIRAEFREMYEANRNMSQARTLISSFHLECQKHKTLIREGEVILSCFTFRIRGVNADIADLSIDPQQFLVLSPNLIWACWPEIDCASHFVRVRRASSDQTRYVPLILVL